MQIIAEQKSALIAGKTIQDSQLVKVEEHNDYRGSFSEIAMSDCFFLLLFTHRQADM